LVKPCPPFPGRIADSPHSTFQDDPVKAKLPALACATLLALGGFARSAEVEPLLPAATEQIIHINVKKGFDSDIVKKYGLAPLKLQLEKKEAKDFLEEIGFDPLKDIESITVAIWGDKPPEEKGKRGTPPDTLSILRGSFDPNKLFAAAEKYARQKPDVVSIVEEGDYKLVRFVSGDGKPGFAAVADEKTLVVGSDKAVVAEAVTTAIKKSKPAIGKALALLVKKQDDNATMFYCGILEDKFKSLPEAKLPPLPLGDWPFEGGKINDGLKNLSTLAVTMRVGKEIFVDMALGMKDQDSADDFGSTMSKLVDLLKTLLPLAALQQPKLQTLVNEFNNTVKTKVKDTTITLSVKLSAEAIGKATGAPDEE
jgi:hypothetical protein